MRALADTHAFLWFAFDDPRLSKVADEALSGGRIVLSKVSLWEIAIKASLRKINLGCAYRDFVDRFVLGREIEILDLDLEHLKENAALPMTKHRDPFDRLLIAQARVEHLPVVTGDPSFKRYGVQLLW